MLNTLVSTGNTMLGRMISGVLALSLDHPFVLACGLATLMGLAVVALLDVISPRADAARRP